MKEYNQLYQLYKAETEVVESFLEALLQLAKDHENRKNIMELSKEGVETYGFSVNKTAFPDLAEQMRRDDIPFVAFEKRIPSSYILRNLSQKDYDMAMEIIKDYKIEEKDVLVKEGENHRKEIVLDSSYRDVFEDICTQIGKEHDEIDIYDYKVSEYLVKVKKEDCMDEHSVDNEIGGRVKEAWDKVVEEKQMNFFEKEIVNDPEMALNYTIYDLSEVEKRQLETYLAKDGICAMITKEEDGYKVETNEIYAEKLNEAYVRTIFDLSGEAGMIRERKLGEEIRVMNEILERAEKGEEFCVMNIRNPHEYIVVGREEGICEVYDGKDKIGSFDINDKEGGLRERLYENPTMFVMMSMDEYADKDKRDNLRMQNYEFYTREELKIIEFDKKINQMVQESITHKDLDGLKNINSFIENFKERVSDGLTIEEMDSIEKKLFETSDKLKQTLVVKKEYEYRTNQKTKEEEKDKTYNKERDNSEKRRYTAKDRDREESDKDI